MKALIEKKREEVFGNTNYEVITKTTWYILHIPVFHSNVKIIR